MINMTPDKIFAVIVLCLTVLFILYVLCIGVPSTIRSERKKFNNGVCPICGERLEHFDTDSGGGRGYCCRSTKHRYYVWVSYNCVDKNYNENSINNNGKIW